MGKAIALQKKHGLKLPVEFHFKYARIALSADSIRIAYESVNRYLSIAGPGGEFYKEALALSLEAEGPEILPEEKCNWKPVGSSCWMELANRPQCYIWNENPKKDETATWSGSCSGGVATGEGTLTFARIVADSIRRHQTVTGRLRKGKYDDGRFIVRDSDGDYMDVSRVDGERHGRFVVRRSDGSTEEGPYLNGERHGRWIIRDSYGRKKEGPYVNGSKHGHWVHTRDKNADPYFVGFCIRIFRRRAFCQWEETRTVGLEAHEWIYIERFPVSKATRRERGRGTEERRLSSRASMAMVIAGRYPKPPKAFLQEASINGAVYATTAGPEP